MTLRDRIRARTRWITAVGVGGWLLLPLSALLTSGHEPPLAVVVLGAALFVGALLALLWSVRCPKCRAPLRQLAHEIAFHWLSRRRVNFCPYCGVSLDETYEAARELR